MKKIWLLTVLLLLQLSAWSMSLRYGDTVTIDEPVHEDLYISAGTVYVNANVYADLVIAGGTVILREKVYGEVLIVAGDCTIADWVAGDVRCMGGKLLLNGDIGEDLATGGGDIRIAPGAMVRGDVLMGGGTLSIDGDVRGSVKAYGGTLNMAGTIDRDLFYRGASAHLNGAVNGRAQIAARRLYLGGNAVFTGDVRYWTGDGSTFKAQVLSGHAVYDPTLAMPTGRWHYAGFATAMALTAYLLVVLVCIGTGVLVFPGTFHRAAGITGQQTGKAMGSGAAFLLLTPLIILGMLITLIGIPVALMLLIGYITLLLLTQVIIAVLLSYWLEIRYRKQWSKAQHILVALGLFVPIKLISLTPVIGWLVILIAAILSFGALWRSRKKGYAATAS